MSRIRLEDIKVGNSYVVDNSKTSKKTESIPQAVQIQEDNSAVSDAEIEAQRIITAAQEEARNIIEQTRQKSEELFNQSHEEGMKAGYNAGYEVGLKQVQEDFTNQIRSVDIIAKTAFNVKKEIIVSAEQEILQLSVVIAEKLLRHQLEVNPELILNIVKAAINELKDKEEVKIVVNPSVTNCLYEFSDELKQSINGLKKIKIIEDKTVPSEGVIIESLESRIDARLDSQITEITKRIMKEAAERPLTDKLVKEIDIKIEEPGNLEE